MEYMNKEVAFGEIIPGGLYEIKELAHLFKNLKPMDTTHWCVIERGELVFCLGECVSGGGPIVSVIYKDYIGYVNTYKLGPRVDL